MWAACGLLNSGGGVIQMAKKDECLMEMGLDLLQSLRELVHLQICKLLSSPSNKEGLITFLLNLGVVILSRKTVPSSPTVAA